MAAQGVTLAVVYALGDDDLRTLAQASAPLKLVVAGSGLAIGIPAAALAKIFNPFFTTKPQGTGLGLAIVRKVVDAHDGRIDAASAPERGATFRITLPVVPSVANMGRR